MKKNSIYTRLSKSRPLVSVIGADYSLWLGPDHLLYAKKEGVSETYRRLFFKDIQGITFTPNDKWLTLYNILPTAILCLAAVGFYLSFGANKEFFVSWLPSILIAFSSFLMFLANFLLGPTCTCHFHTAVQQESIQAINRLRTARKVMAKILPYIEAAQGPLQPEQIEAVAASENNLRLAEKTAKPQKPFRHSLAKYHAAFFILMLLMSVSNFVDMFVASSVKDFFDTIAILLMMLAGTIAVVDQRRTFIHIGLQRLTLFSLICQAIIFFAFIIVGTMYGVIMAANGGGVAALDGFRTSDIFLWFVMLQGIISLVLAVLGLMRLRVYYSALNSWQAIPGAQVPDGA